MPRAIWSGSISFGLVNIPVKLYNAVSRKNVSFNQIDARTRSRVRMQRVNAGEKPYVLLVRAMEEQQKVAIASFVMRTKQYLAALRPKDGKLLISTMVYADEIVPDKEIPEFDGLEDIDVSAKELAMATQLIESLSDDFVPDQFRDEYREKVLDLIEQKAAGVETVVATPQPADEGRVVDLMAALEASVQAA